MSPTRPLHYYPALAAVVAAVAILASAARAETPVLSVLLSAPRWHEDADEPDDERTERLARLARGIEAATTRRYERALLLTQLRHESHAARFVHLDEPRCRDGIDGWCDSGRAWSPWQLHGTDRTGDETFAARLALSRLRHHARNCGYGSLATPAAVRAAVSGYALGGGCRWAGADERVATWRVIVERL